MIIHLHSLVKTLPMKGLVNKTARGTGRKSFIMFSSGLSAMSSTRYLLKTWKHQLTEDYTC